MMNDKDLSEVIYRKKVRIWIEDLSIPTGVRSYSPTIPNGMDKWTAMKIRCEELVLYSTQKCA